MENFKVIGTLPNGITIQMLCEKKQIPMVKQVLKERKATDIKVLPDYDYGKTGKGE